MLSLIMESVQRQWAGALRKIQAGPELVATQRSPCMCCCGHASAHPRKVVASPCIHAILCVLMGSRSSGAVFVRLSRKPAGPSGAVAFEKKGNLYRSGYACQPGIFSETQHAEQSARAPPAHRQTDRSRNRSDRESGPFTAPFAFSPLKSIK